MLLAWILRSALAFPPLPEPDPAATPEASRMGRVLETFDSGGFTYIELQTDAEALWIAGPLTAVAVGDTVATTEGALMADFHSRTLDRTFSRIWFVAGVRLMGPELQQADASAAVPRAEGGITVAEAHARAAELRGTEVVIAARVVKASAGILGHNWLHVQDGSGLAGDGTHDLAVTTAPGPIPAVGDTVRIRGHLATDRDFGAGYRYAILIEDADIEVSNE